MKKTFAFFTVCALLFCAILPAHAAEGKVTYSGNSGNIIFAPGSDQSPTDLFPEFKEVMPGDTITQQITVRNDADDQVKVKIYLRALGAHEGSEAFLSQLRLKAATSQENEMAYMFDAAADETAGLTDWFCLGTLYSGGEVNLDVTLSVPVDLGNEFQDSVGFLDWEFMIEELPVDPDDPNPPTKDRSRKGLWLGAGAATVAILLLLIWRKAQEEPKEPTAQ